MKRILFTCLALSAITLCACSTPPSSTATAASPTATMAVMNTTEMEKTVIEHEKKMWELGKNKQADEYKKFLAPGYRKVLDEEIKDSNQDVEAMLAGDLKEFTLTDFQVTFPNPNTAVLVFKAVQKGSYKGADMSGNYHASSVWVKQDGNWMNVLYSEVKAAQPPKK
jgi:hypothetical protein